MLFTAFVVGEIPNKTTLYFEKSDGTLISLHKQTKYGTLPHSYSVFRLHVNEELLHKMNELDSLLRESVLLSVQSKEVFRRCAGQVKHVDELLVFHQMLTNQKWFIIDYLSESLRKNSLWTDVILLAEDMRLEYRRKLKQEEEKNEQNSKSEVLAFMREFQMMEA